MKHTPKTTTYKELIEWAKTKPEDDPVEIDLLARTGAIAIRYTTVNAAILTREVSQTQTLVVVQTEREHFDPSLDDIFNALNRSADPDEVRDLAEFFMHLAEELEE